MNTATLQAADWRHAQVIAAFGRHALLRNAKGATAIGRPASRRLQVVCGDEVQTAGGAPPDELLIDAIEPRRSALWRCNARLEPEIVVANVSLLLAVVAPVPAPDFYVIDRYLAAADAAGLAAIVGAGKDDLPRDAVLDAELANYAALGYGTLRFAAGGAPRLDAVRAAIRGQCCLVVGQSGVGKSSLITQLAPGSDAAIGALIRGVEGRHTTTASRLHRIDAATAVMDTPGVRDFAPALERLDARSLGFRELDTLAPRCRFSDCRHLQEPGCAVRAATESGGMSARRYESYRRLRRLHNDRVTALRQQGSKPR